jgi:WD40 repeat protein
VLTDDASWGKVYCNSFYSRKFSSGDSVLRSRDAVMVKQCGWRTFCKFLTQLKISKRKQESRWSLFHSYGTGFTDESFNGHKNSIRCLSDFLPHGDAQLFIASGSDDKDARFWEIEPQAEDPLVCAGVLQGHSGPVYSVKLIEGSNGDQLLLSASFDRSVRVWKKPPQEEKSELLPQWECSNIIQLPVMLQCIDVFESADQSFAATIGWNGRVYIVDYLKGSILCEFQAHEKAGMVVKLIELDQDILLLTTGQDPVQNFKLWKTSKKNIGSGPMQFSHQCSFLGHQHAVFCLDVIGDKVFTGGVDQTMRMWKLVPGENEQFGYESLREFSIHKGLVWSLQVFGSIVFSCSQDKTIKMLDSSTGEIIHEIKGDHTVGSVGCMQLLPNGYLISAGAERIMRLWRFNIAEKKFESPSNDWFCTLV